MLRYLNLTHIILVESASIPFREGLNILSGETGSGKSAILEALLQIGGARSDSRLIRHGAEKGTIEAAFDIDQMPQLKSLLHEAGIDHLEGEELILKREIEKEGRSRAFINHQLVTLAVLKKVGGWLLDIVGQHANQKLCEISYHLQVVDTYGEHEALCRRFEASWKEELALRAELEQLILGEQQRMREIDRCQRELKELDEAALKEGEEEELFAEYVKLSQAEELMRLSEKISAVLSEQVVTGLREAESAFEELSKHDNAVSDIQRLLRSTTLELEEVVYTLQKKYSDIENNPERVQFVDERLRRLNQIKKKYGPAIADAIRYQIEQAEKLTQLENSEEKIAGIEKKLSKIEEENKTLAAALTKKRMASAEKLEMEATRLIQELNMPKAQFFATVTPQKRSHTGEDRVEFFFSPNTGERQVSIKECASGGELSRLMLALQTILAGKEAVPTLVFDEIDSNIGGQTAALVGEKLQQIGQNHQVLCVTHFPQVAQFAHHHIQISKVESEGRTFTRVETLDSSGRQKELGRMSGDLCLTR